MTVLAMGVSHRSAPLEVLERLALDREAVTKVLDDVRTSTHLSEAVVVATCNRLEIYVDAATFHGGVDEVSSLLTSHTDVPVEALTPYLYVYYDERAVSHLFSMVSGLDSMVVGEAQILGQAREAFRLAQTSGATGRVLSELFSAALRVGKRAHAETGIDAAGRSLVTIGLAQVLPKVLADADGRSWRDLAPSIRALVVGAGSMAALAAATLRREGADVVVANRTEDRGSRLAESVEGTAIPMRAVADTLDDVDVVVSCTGAAGVVLPYEMVEAAVARRQNRPRGRSLGIVDLALPHDVDEGVAGLPGVVLADLARLRAAADADLNGSRSIEDDVAAVRAIVASEVGDFSSARRAAEVAPTVIALRAMAGDVVDAELYRLAGKLPDLDLHAQAEISATVRRVVDKLLHSPIVRVKELATQPDGVTYERALRQLFALDPRSVDAVVRPDIEGMDT